ncbi:MAG TPA: hypothetical protein VIJ36_19645, partial [Thermoanaerobaculia bacterium]
TMTAVLRDEPPDLPAAVPPALDRVVRHCLEKNQEARFHSASDLAFQLETEVAERSGTGGRQPLPRRPVRRRAWVPALAAALLIATVSVLLGHWLWAPAATPFPIFRQLTFQRGAIHSARFAPDGTTIVYGAAWNGEPLRLFTTRTDSSESTPLGLPDADVLSISRAGEMALSLGRRFSHNPYISRGTLAQAPLAGGLPRELSQDVQQADWAPDGTHLAVLRGAGLNGMRRLEYPVGKVLYSAFWLDTPRVSPRGDLVTVLDGTGKTFLLLVLDREGRRKLSVPLEGWPQGLAWHPSGDEVWWATNGAQGAVLGAVRLTGERRALFRMAGFIRLLDVSRQGRALITLSQVRYRMTGLGAGEAQERDLSWFDLSLAKDLSADGRRVLFDEQGANYGRGGVYLRGMDGSPAVRLGDGVARSLSPDGKWALTLDPRTNTLVLLPIGPGSPRPLAKGPFEFTGTCSWFPDGRRILISGREPGQDFRLYVQDLAGGRIRPLTPPGTSIPYGYISKPISPDGRQVAALDADGRMWIFPMEAGLPRLAPGFIPGDELLRWSADGRAVFLWRSSDSPLRIFRLDLATGEKTLFREIRFPDPAGIYTTTTLVMTPDGGSYAYSYGRMLSTLYLVEGLK